ncbi:Transglutaminase-like superfamily [Seminavis robusta]|uniref:Transglutaminase-like superfamily n=1 Tax=Seminavis robusta TaxID=568900 RepID=A0A9N8EDA1_9STRA|nr:Transglutaminase-like superfamily [Seminavis robusta]|eukprot:Sro954_g224330.1 Transglutaminase-like superfamily (231) ;mRNA; r:22690-23382
MTTLTPTVKSIVRALRATTSTPREVAVALHDYVRDEIAFGFTNRFDLVPVETTLQLGRGHCTPKANLFVHLFREAGFHDATVVAVPIPNTVFDKMGGKFPPQVHHCFTQVTVEGKKCRVDSYVTDRALFEKARAQLDRTEHADMKLGFCIHRQGTCEWDGASDAFSQYVDQTPKLERRYSSTAELVADKDYYLHSNVAPILNLPLLGRVFGSLTVESNNGPVHNLRQTTV